MKKNNLWFKISLTAFCLLFVFSLTVSAANLGDAFKTKDTGPDDPLDKTAATAGFKITADASDINKLIAVVIQDVLGLLGIIFLILVIYGGVNWMTAEGDEEKVKKARKIVTNATIGLVIVIAAYAISYFVVNALSSKTLT
jgi:hypothetical protein